MADTMLTHDQIVHLVRREAMDRGIIPVPSIFVDPKWCPERLYVGTAHTSLTSEARTLTPELFGARVIRPLLDHMAGQNVPLDRRFEPFVEQPPERVRGETHGDYNEITSIAQSIKATMRRGSSWGRMSAGQREALELIATKIGRIVCGDPNHKDHWADIGGYANLVNDRIAVPPARKETPDA